MKKINTLVKRLDSVETKINILKDKKTSIEEEIIRILTSKDSWEDFLNHHSKAYSLWGRYKKTLKCNISWDGKIIFSLEGFAWGEPYTDKTEPISIEDLQKFIDEN